MTSRRTGMAYFVLSPNDGDSLNTLFSSDPDPGPGRIRGGPSHRVIVNTPCLNALLQYEP